MNTENANNTNGTVIVKIDKECEEAAAALIAMFEANPDKYSDCQDSEVSPFAKLDGTPSKIIDVSDAE